MARKHVVLGIGGIGGVIGATVAWKLATRASTVNFEDHADQITHAENSKFIEVDGNESCKKSKRQMNWYLLSLYAHLNYACMVVV